MKLRPLLTLCAALLALSPDLATAQTTSAIPGFISYQGRVVNAAGVNVGKDAPVNRTVIFRIWDSPSSTNTANLIYSESQTVTVSDGEFSVLVGQGVANTTQTFGYPEAGTDKKLADFSAAFNRSPLYLGVTVAAENAIATTDNEITPRQQIVSTAFAMRAKFAENVSGTVSLAKDTDFILNPGTLPPGSVASNYGLGWYGSGRLFNGTAMDGPVLYGNSGGALGSNASGTQKTALRWDASGRVGIGAASIASATNKLTLQGDMATTPGDQLTIRGNADNNKRLSLGYDTTANKATLQSYTAASTVGPLLLNPSGGNVGVNKVDPSVALDVTGAVKASSTIAAGTSLSAVTSISAGTNITAGANVGIGTTTPGFPLSFANNLGDKIALWGSSGNSYGFGVQGGLLQIHTDGVAGDIAFGYGSSAAMTETMRIKGNGAVSIPGSLTTGSLSVTGLVNMGSGTGTRDAPNRALIIRRLNSTTSAAGSVVAVGGNGQTLVRDGTTGGFTIKTTVAGNQNIFVKVYSRNGSLLRSVNKAYFQSIADYVVCTDAENASRIEVTMVNGISTGDFTEVTLTRFIDAISTSGTNFSNWVGTVNSTVNQ